MLAKCKAQKSPMTIEEIYLKELSLLKNELLWLSVFMQLQPPKLSIPLKLLYSPLTTK